MESNLAIYPHLRNGMIFQLSKKSRCFFICILFILKGIQKDFLSLLGQTLVNGGPLELRLWIVVGADMCWQCETTSTTKMCYILIKVVTIQLLAENKLIPKMSISIFSQFNNRSIHRERIKNCLKCLKEAPNQLVHTELWACSQLTRWPFSN